MRIACWVPKAKNTSSECVILNGMPLPQLLQERTSTVTLYVQCQPFYFIAVAQWLRCCATNRKVAGSIPDGVIAIFH